MARRQERQEVGKKDKRNWPEENERLVRRGEMYIYPDYILISLKIGNKDKEKCQ